MALLTARTLGGTWATVLLPLDERERIDWARLAAQLDVLLGAGVDGIYTNGTSGEFYNLSPAEFERLSELVAERCREAGMPFQLGAGDANPRVMLERVKRVAAMGPGAIQIILPDWFPLSDGELGPFLTGMVEAAAPVGLVLYNPPHAKRVLGAAEVGRLAASEPGLIGVKVGGGGARWFAELRRYAPELSVFVPGHELASQLRCGAQGSYSNVACLHPVAAARWHRQMHEAPEVALELEGRIQRFLHGHITPRLGQGGYSNQAADKLLAAIGGWAEVGTRLRWPYRGFDPSEADRLRPIAKRMLPEFFPP